MMVARWSINAKFGYKQNVIDLMQRWLREIGPQAGFSADKVRLLTGSIGALEATVQSEHLVKDLNELNQVWDKLATIAAHKQCAIAAPASSPPPGSRRSSRTPAPRRTSRRAPLPSAGSRCARRCSR